MAVANASSPRAAEANKPVFEGDAPHLDDMAIQSGV